MDFMLTGMVYLEAGEGKKAGLVNNLEGVKGLVEGVGDSFWCFFINPGTIFSSKCSIAIDEISLNS